MTGYDFRPEASVDLDEIWEFIAADNLDAADKVIEDILGAIDVLVPFPHQPVTFHTGAGLSHCLRAG